MIGQLVSFWNRMKMLEEDVTATVFISHTSNIRPQLQEENEG